MPSGSEARLGVGQFQTAEAFSLRLVRNRGSFLAADRAEHRVDQHAIHPIVDIGFLRRPSVCHSHFGIDFTDVDTANVNLPHAW